MEGDCAAAAVAVAVAVARLMDYAGQHSPHLPLEKIALVSAFAAFGPTRTNAFPAGMTKADREEGRTKAPAARRPLKEKTHACDLSPQLLEGWGEFPLPWLPSDPRLFVKQRTA